MEMPMTVIRKLEDGGLKLAVLDLGRDVLYAATDGCGRLVFHTAQGEYYALTSPEQLEAFVPDYWILDRTNAVNMAKAKQVDRQLNVRFEDSPAPGGKITSVARIAKKHASRYLQEQTRNV